ncbi:patatin-like phospholipase family protein [Dongia sp.]|uniref:patatin-like phospholipase family protein n=1 Tax=Dongia sp. TaxID=1977262 RepID=UPI003753B4CA
MATEEAIDTAEMLEKERRAVEALREKETDGPWLGLALSGGGIRSASFAMGVMQGLHARGVMKNFDYLSTVSGGGYIGSSLSYFLVEHGRRNPKNQDFWFPFGARGQSGARGDRTLTPLWNVRHPDVASNLAVQIVSFIRQHAHYLTPTPRLGIFALVANALRAVLFSLGIYFALMVIVMALAFGTGLVIRLPALGRVNLFVVLGLLAFIASAFATVAYSVFSFLDRYINGHDSETGEPIRRFYRRVSIPLTVALGWLLQVQIACVALGSLPFTYGWAERHGGGDLYGAISVAIAYLGTWREKHATIIGKLKESPVWKSVWPYLYAVLAVYGILFLAYGTAQYLGDPFGANWIWFAVLVILTLLFALLTNLNLVSQHRMYRDRLMEALCPDPKSVEKGIWHPAKIADALQLSVLAGGVNSGKKKKEDPAIRIVGPYHLINTALIIPDSEKPKYSGRGADSFVLSPRFCGSDATHWLKTEQYMDDQMVLPTAMAISGAALNAHSGPDGKGMLRTPLISFLVTLFGAQLGYWAPNPGKPQQLQQTANYLRPGLSGLLGYRMDEHGGFLQLSDGGHFENLGLYELVRRKMDLILVSDGGQDGDFTFADLGNAIERVRVDFGVNIRFDDECYTLEGVLPKPREAKSETWRIKFGLAKRGFALASIWYPDRQSCGVLIYVKATMVDGLPSDLYAYKAQNPEYPDQTTLDQFFDEDQFEAYRELGYNLVKQMFAEFAEEATAAPESLLATAVTFLAPD